jgi:beta-lactamase regulating signal transducer with metallopeptidase domain
MTDLLRDCANLYPLILEAALRALLAAAVVWAGLRLLRVANVVVMKAAWALVLVASIALPLTPGLRNAPAWAAFRLPAVLASSMMRQANANPSAQSIVPAQSAPAIAAAPMADAAVGRYSSPAISDEHYGSTSTKVIENPQVDGATVEGASESQPSTVSDVSKTPAASLKSIATIPNRFSARAAAFCLLMYVTVALALFVRLLVGVATAIRIWMTAWPVSMLMDPTWSVRASIRVASPVNIGSGIVLPAEYGEWDEEKLRIVVAHERSHIRQGDFYLQLLAGLYASVFWFSPLGWWLKRKLNELGEAISDRAGLEEAASRASYAQILLEFAALPRPTFTGVAMARTSHLSQRIERLLNESSFRQAFAGSGRRVILAVVLVPLALLTATSLVSVQAATPSVQTQPAAVTGQSMPEEVTEVAPAAAPAAAQEPAATTAPSPAPAPTAAPEAMPAPPVPAAMPDMGAMPPLPGVPDKPVHVEVGPIVVNPHVRVHPQIAAMPPMPPMPAQNFHFNANDFAMAYGFGQDGDPYAVVGSDGKMMMPHRGFFRGENDDQAEVDKARKQAHGAFLWFKHDGKSYMVDDPSIVSQIEAMSKPMDDLQNQMRDLGKQMHELGEQQRAKAKAMRDNGVQTPDLSKEIAALKAAEASLQAKQGGTITQKEIGDLQRELGKAMGELGSLQGKLMMDQSGFGKAMGEFGEQQGKLGGQMGKLGSEMGRIARENQSKVKGIIDESLANGKAKPVQ